MPPNILVQSDFCGDLLGLDASGLVGVPFMDELYCYDGFRGFEGTCFADEGVGSLAECARNDAEREVRGERLLLYLRS